MDQFRLETLVHLRAQAAEVRFDDVGSRIEVILPDILEQHRAGDSAVLIAHEIFENAKFARLQKYFAAGSLDAPPQHIDHQIRRLQRRLHRQTTWAPSERSDA